MSRDRLAVVVRVRALRERLARSELADAQRRLAAAEAGVARAAEATRTGPQAGPVAPAALQVRRVQGLAAAELLAEARGERAAAAARRDARARACVDAATAHRAVERLAERLADGRARDAARAEARELDELVLTVRGRT